MLLKSINYWSLPGGLEGSLPLPEFFRLASENRFDVVEVAIGSPGTALGTNATESDCKEILQAATAAGVRIGSVASGLYWGRNLASADRADREGAREDLQAMLQITSWLGAKTLLTIPGAVDVFFMPDRAPLSYEHVWNYATEGIRSLLPVAEQCRVKMGIENVWNKFLMTPQEIAAFVDQFSSPWVGSYLDVGNLLPFGYAEDWIRHLGKRIVGVHFKDFRRAVGSADGFVDLLEGDVNWPEVVRALKDVGYEGPCAAEMIPGYKFHPMVRIANTSNAMDAILG